MFCEKCRTTLNQKIVIEVTAEEEDETPEQSERATGSAPGYAEAVHKVMAKAESGWGWCVAKVTAKLMVGDQIINQASDYLGNCSYLSAQDFILHSGYFPGMHDRVIQELASKNEPNAPERQADDGQTENEEE